MTTVPTLTRTLARANPHVDPHADPHADPHVDPHADTSLEKDQEAKLAPKTAATPPPGMGETGGAVPGSVLAAPRCRPRGPPGLPGRSRPARWRWRASAASTPAAWMKSATSGWLSKSEASLRTHAWPAASRWSLHRNRNGEREMGVGMLSAASGRKTIHDGYPASSRRRDWPETQGRARGRGPRPPIRRSQTPGTAPGPRPAGARAGAGSAGDRGARGARCTGSSRQPCLCCRDPTFPSRPPTTDDAQSWFVSARHAAPGGLRRETRVR